MTLRIVAVALVALVACTSASSPTRDQTYLNQMHALHSRVIDQNANSNLIDAAKGNCFSLTAKQITPAEIVRSLVRIAWPENVAAAAVKIEIKNYCPGI